jgi:Rrf2 family transcriptional regulator, iron-sulfur cluster assembly transcription factor
VRGPAGGYFLARRPEEITVGDVIRAIDGMNIELVNCHGDKRESRKPCKRLEKCVTSDIWGEASRRLMDYFDSVTLHQICEEARERGVGI